MPPLHQDPFDRLLSRGRGRRTAPGDSSSRSACGATIDAEAPLLTETARIDKSGRILIPAPYRKALGIGAGDEVVVMLEGDSVRLLTARQALHEARQLLKLSGRGRKLTGELIQERRAEALRD